MKKVEHLLISNSSGDSDGGGSPPVDLSGF